MDKAAAGAMPATQHAAQRCTDTDLRGPRLSASKLLLRLLMRPLGSPSASASPTTSSASAGAAPQPAEKRPPVGLWALGLLTAATAMLGREPAQVASW